MLLREEVLALEKHAHSLSQDHQLAMKQNRRQIEQLTATKEMEKVVVDKDRTILSLKKQLQVKEVDTGKHGRSL